MNNGPFFTPQVLSAGRGKICYNVESHINGGGITTHQAMLGMDDLLHDFIPQIGLGIKGFLFWQYRPEVLGIEAPAWGSHAARRNRPRDHPSRFAVRPDTGPRLR